MSEIAPDRSGRFPIVRIVNPEGEHYFCETVRCGSNFFHAIRSGVALCNSCLQPARMTSGSVIEIVKNPVPVLRLEWFLR